MSDFPVATIPDLNAQVAQLPQSVDVRYMISASKSFNYDGDILLSISTDLTLQCAAPTTKIEALKLPWGENLPMIVNGGFQFVSYTVEPNYDNRMATFTRWSEVYRKTTESAAFMGKWFDVTESIEFPAWLLRFSYWTNPKLGGTDQEAVTRRLRQAFGLSPVQGEIQAKTFTPIDDNANPYDFLNVNFATFDGAIKSAVVSQATENGRAVYTLSLSWTGGNVAAGALPTYKL